MQKELFFINQTRENASIVGNDQKGHHQSVPDEKCDDLANSSRELDIVPARVFNTPEGYFPMISGLKAIIPNPCSDAPSFRCLPGWVLQTLVSPARVGVSRPDELWSVLAGHAAALIDVRKVSVFRGFVKTFTLLFSYFFFHSLISFLLRRDI